MKKYITNILKSLSKDKARSTTFTGVSTTANKKSYVYGFMSVSVSLYMYDKYSDSQIELFYKPTEFNKKVIENVDRLRSGVYQSSPLLLTRFMEVVYANKFDNRVYFDYQTEVLMTSDNENLALGCLNRLVI